MNTKPQRRIDLPGLPDVFFAPKIVDEEPGNHEAVDLSSCPDCGIKVQRRDTQVCICPSCGLEVLNECAVDYYSDDLMHSYTGSQTNSLRIVGPTKAAKVLSNKFMGLTSEYNATRFRRIMQKINAWVYQVNEGDNIPLNVCEAAAEAYVNFQNSEYLVKRAGGLKAVLSILLYVKCIEMNVPRKPKVITGITGIQDNQLSCGDKILREMSQKGVIEIPKGGGKSDDYIDQYFEKLNLIKYAYYKQFVIDLVAASSVEKIKTSYNSARPTTRCAGALFILCQQMKLPVTRDQIATECNISKSTFARFVKMIIKHKEKKCIRKVFERYGVPPL